MYNITNAEVREKIRKSGLYAYQVAERIGMTETSFSRMMRHELSPKRRQQILNALHDEERQDT